MTRRKKKRPPPLHRYPPENYTRAECMALLGACKDNWYGWRDEALIIVLWRSGLRLAEALALTPKDVDFQSSSIRVLHGKGDKARTVGMDARESGILRAWLETRGDYSATTPIFCTRQGKRLPQSYVRRMLPELAKRAGVDKRVHAHGFRHTYAVELMREGVRIKDIQTLLGHSSLQVTSLYLASLSPEEALDAVRGREW